MADIDMKALLPGTLVTVEVKGKARAGVVRGFQRESDGKVPVMVAGKVIWSERSSIEVNHGA
jgi:hypothetical protein